MNYDAKIHDIIESLKADKTIPAEYRNAVISSARRLQLEIRGAKTMIIAQPPQGLSGNETAASTFLSGETIGDQSTQAAAIQNGSCICTPGMPPRKYCPVHGTPL